MKFAKNFGDYYQPKRQIFFSLIELNDFKHPENAEKSSLKISQNVFN
jgi:hypothetical protein